MMSDVGGTDRLMPDSVLTYIYAMAICTTCNWVCMIRGSTQIMMIPFYGEFSIVLQHKPPLGPPQKGL